MSVEIAEYGFWKSPITSDVIVSESIRVGGVALSQGDVYWLEGRPAERGRNVLVRRRADGRTQDVTPSPFNVRSRAHEYGGGAYTLDADTVYFSNDSDQRLYRIQPGREPEPITPEGPLRYADARIHGGRLYAIREDHRAAPEPRNTIIALDASEPSVLAQGRDFYSNPRPSPDGRRLCWLEWSLPNMPWDGTELWTAALTPDGLDDKTLIAGGPAESIFQPEWGPDGALYFVSDRSGWWNLYRSTPDAEIEPVIVIAAELGYPQWVFGWSTYAFESLNRAVCAFNTRQGWSLGLLDLESKRFDPIETPDSDISEVHAAPGRAVYRGGSPAEPAAIVSLDLSSGRRDVLRRSAQLPDELRPFISIPRAIEFPTESGLTAHAFFYPPHNPRHAAPADEKPPLIVTCHGGPTAQADSTLDLRVQFWTSRGFAFVDVNYGGSSGFGREYRERLAGAWGVVDLDDCANAAQYLVAQGAADPARLIIRGASAGGYTTLAALAFRDVFSAGASYYGVSDLESLAADTHKFESRYLDKLVGSYPQAKALYQQRSPIRHVDGLNAAVIFFHGAEDRVVPPGQAESMVAALRRKSLPVNYLLFDGEQHGFRIADNIKRALDAELYFYSTVLLRKGVRF